MLRGGVALPGLDSESRHELASLHGLAESDPAALQQLLDWSGGVPWIIVSLREYFDDATRASSSATAARLRAFRYGGLDLPEADRYLQALGLPEAERMIRVWMPAVAFTLFKGFLDAVTWSIFCQALMLKTAGSSQTPAKEFFQQLMEQMALTRHGGLVCGLSDSLLFLHPLAPAYFRDGLHAVARAGRDPTDTSSIAQMYAIYLSTYCETIRIMMIVHRAPARPRYPYFSVFEIDMQNVLYATECAYEHRSWELFFQLAKDYRAVLKAQKRGREWRELLHKASSELGEEDVTRAGLVNPVTALLQLLADEYQVEGDTETVARIHGQIMVGGDRGVTVKPAEEEGPVLDIGKQEQYSNLRRLGDALVEEGSAECLAAYEGARQIALELKQGLAVAVLELRIAKAYLKVPTIQDDSLYEKWARSALKRAMELGVLGQACAAEAANSVAQALIRQVDAGTAPDRDAAIEEAITLLRSARTEAAGAPTRTSVKTGLARLHVLRGESDKAVAEFLEAADDFEGMGDLASAIECEYNAAVVLGRAGRLDEMMNIAHTALEKLARYGGSSAKLRSALESLINYRR